MPCVYCRKRLVQPTVRDVNKDYHLRCYMDKEGSKIFTKSMLCFLIWRLEFMSEISDNAVDKSISTEESRNRFEAIKIKYADCENLSTTCVD